MATLAKILGKFKPGAAADQIVYTVPTGKHTVLEVTAANQSGTADTVRVGVVLAAGVINWATDAKAFDVTVIKDAPLQVVGIALGDDEDLVCRSTNGTTSFVATGLESDV